MNASPARRKVLIIEDEPSIRNILEVLVAGLGCEGDIASSGRQALAKIDRENFDAVLLDLRCSSIPAHEVVAQIQNVQPSLLGRVLVITGDVSDPKAIDLIERYFLLQLSRSRLAQDLQGMLRALLLIRPSPISVR